MAADGQEIVVPQETAPPVLTGRTPMDLLALALERGDDLSVLEKLMDLQDRHERGQARKAFDAAVAEAKAKIKPVTKNRQGNNSKYADLAAYAKEIDPVLAEHGLSYRYSSRQENGIQITCILSHRDGHSQETTLAGAPDKTGSKNDIQAIGSTVEYLKRYTLTLALGLSAAEADDDGQAAGGDEAISIEEAELLRKKLDDAGADIERFCAYLKVEALTDIRKSKFKDALAAVAAKAKVTKSKKADAQ